MNNLPVSLNPASGEIWVADLHLQYEGADEVVFQLVDSKGDAYGQLLTLERSLFERRYCCKNGKWEIRLQVLEAGSGSVLYQQLDNEGHTLDEPKRVGLVIFVRNFRLSKWLG